MMMIDVLISVVVVAECFSSSSSCRSSSFHLSAYPPLVPWHTSSSPLRVPAPSPDARARDGVHYYFSLQHNSEEERSSCIFESPHCARASAMIMMMMLFRHARFLLLLAQKIP